MPIDTLSDDLLLRYSRHLMLPAIDVAGQLALCNSRVLVIGVGGLGSPVAMYLAASGVGHLTLVDDDVVDNSNLQRQVVHTEARIGQLKVDSAREQLLALNSQVSVACISERLTESALKEQVSLASVVVDCSDNFSSRQLANRICVELKTPLVSGAAIRMEAQLATFDPRQETSPCYQCWYDLSGEADLSCSESGVLSPLVGVAGSMQALEVVKVLVGCGRPLVGRVLLFDAMRSEWREFKLNKDPNCSVCGSVTS